MRRPWAGRRWSISGWLTVSYALSAFVLVASATWLQYRSLVQDLAAEDDDLVRVTTSAVARDLAVPESVAPPDTGRIKTGRNQRDGPTLLTRWRHPATSNGPLVRLVSPACEIIDATADDGALPPARCTAPSTGATALHSWLSPSGTDWRIATTLLPDGNRLEILLDRHTDTAILTRSRRQLGVVLLLVLCIAGITGYLIARYGLSPIDRLSSRVRSIDAQSLDQRLALTNAPEEVRALTASFDDLLERLHAAFGALAQYSAEMAHELRTPLHILRQHVEVALAQTRTPEEYRDVLSVNLEEIERLRRMSDDMLFLARSQDPRAHLEREELGARAELLAVAEFMDALSEDRQVAVNVQAPEDLIFVGDQRLIRRALVNLMSNALEHTPRGGAIHLCAHGTPGHVTLRVEDTGVGIAHDLIPRIFDRYARHRRRSPGERSGVGLGLAIVRGIAQLHGGEARAENIPGSGAAMSLILPVNPAQSPDRTFTA